LKNETSALTWWSKDPTFIPHFTPPDFTCSHLSLYQLFHKPAIHKMFTVI